VNMISIVFDSRSTAFSTGVLIHTLSFSHYGPTSPSQPVVFLIDDLLGSHSKFTQKAAAPRVRPAIIISCSSTTFPPPTCCAFDLLYRKNTVTGPRAIVVSLAGLACHNIKPWTVHCGVLVFSSRPAPAEQKQKQN